MIAIGSKSYLGESGVYLSHNILYDSYRHRAMILRFIYSLIISNPSEVIKDYYTYSAAHNMLLLLKFKVK